MLPGQLDRHDRGRFLTRLKFERSWLSHLATSMGTSPLGLHAMVSRQKPQLRALERVERLAILGEL